MIAARLLLAVCSALSGPEGSGAIEGVVLNASRNAAPVARAEVVLRIQVDGQFVPFRETTADAQGRFVFENLPLGAAYLYLPGANADGVHYPGPRTRLTLEGPRRRVELSVCDAVAAPCPLVIRRQEIDIRPEPGALRVTESLLIENPSPVCYVGQTLQEGGEPITLRLAIPADFERATFDEEFLGRRFVLLEGKLATTIPWLPGQREVKLTYVLPNQQRCRAWERPLDLPCSQVRVRVHSDNPQEVSCNLTSASAEQRGEAVFELGGRTLPAGHVIRVELGRLPVPWMAYARWFALGILGALVATASAVMVRRRKGEGRAGSEEHHGGTENTEKNRRKRGGVQSRNAKGKWNNSQYA